MAIKLEDKTRVTAPDSDFIYGDIKDTTPGTPGTPMNKFVYGDFHQFFAKMSDIVGIVLNGLYDSAYSGFQYFQALLGLGFKYYTDPIILGLLGSYTQGDVIILNGVVITLSNSNNTATWTKGDIYYNPDTTKPGKVYKVAAGTTTKSSGVFLFTITDDEDCLIQITHGTSGTGIADYNASTVKKLTKVMAGTWVDISSSLINGFTATNFIRYKIDFFGNVTIQGSVSSGVSSGTDFITGLPAAIRLPSTSSGAFYFPARSNDFGREYTIELNNSFTGNLAVYKTTQTTQTAIPDNIQFQFMFSYSIL